MPVLYNQRREIFAQEIAKGKTATQAMKAANYSDPRNSTRLTNNDEVRRRVVLFVASHSIAASGRSLRRLKGH
jgi:hypothetical protein